MLLGLLTGFVAGAAAIYFDVYVTEGVLGLSNPYAVFALGVMWVLSLLGFASSDNKAGLLGNVLGIPVGLALIDLMRVEVFEQRSMLPILWG